MSNIGDPRDRRAVSSCKDFRSGPKREDENRDEAALKDDHRLIRPIIPGHELEQSVMTQREYALTHPIMRFPNKSMSCMPVSTGIVADTAKFDRKMMIKIQVYRYRLT